MWARVWLACAAPCLWSCIATDESVPPRPPEWFEIGAAVFDRDQGPADPVDDAQGFLLRGGYDFAHGPTRYGFEFGVEGAQHDVHAPGSSGHDPELDSIFYSAGMRMDVDFTAVPLGVWFDGGYGWRDEEDHGAGFENDQGCVYLGLGLDCWYAPDASFGPFYRWTRGDEDGLEENVIGFAARFYFGDGKEHY